VQVLEGVWADTSRAQRAVPWRLYVMQGATSALPLVVYSHGGGGTLRGNGHLARALAAQGHAVLYLQHEGSDLAALRRGAGRLREAANDPAHVATRVGDIAFAVHTLRRDQGIVAGTTARIDPSRFGLAGHSLGALTALVAAGQRLTGHEDLAAVQGLVAVIAYSPGPPRPSIGDAMSAFSSMRVPILHVTGTRDTPPDDAFDVSARCMPFDTITGVEQVLLVLDGADHLSLAGNDRLTPWRHGSAQESLHRTVVRAASLAFWQRWLGAQPNALQALQQRLGKPSAKELALEFKSAMSR
jgi:predicted dienelactone hydrolase